MMNGSTLVSFLNVAFKPLYDLTLIFARIKKLHLHSNYTVIWILRREVSAMIPMAYCKKQRIIIFIKNLV